MAPAGLEHRDLPAASDLVDEGQRPAARRVGAGRQLRRQLGVSEVATTDNDRAVARGIERAMEPAHDARHSVRWSRSAAASRYRWITPRRRTGSHLPHLKGIPNDEHSLRMRVAEVRPSRLMWSYGIGALVDLPRLAVVVEGLERWNPTVPPSRRASVAGSSSAPLGSQVAGASRAASRCPSSAIARWNNSGR